MSNDSAILMLGEGKTPQEMACKKKEDALRQYLLSLGNETDNDIIAIMYLGRSGDYAPSESSVDRFVSYRRYMDNHPWEEKWKVVRQMTEKIPLDEYLVTGMWILEMR